tara:strand:- start:636 stop:1958 length:1323 start_codon:yes stop_codon:yes gene_type:complete
MKLSFLLIFFILLNNCSFDNKSGIWTGSDQISKKKADDSQNLKLIFKKKSNSIKEKELPKNKYIVFDKPSSFSVWSQRYQNKFNNIGNLTFSNEGNYKKLSKISKSRVNENILFYKDNLIFSDIKGNIGIFSPDQNRLIFSYNFYKKKIKAEKNIKLIIKDDSIIAADNFGYVYSINYKKNKLNWAKNFLIPFRSNLKIQSEILFLSDEKNKIILIDIKNGNKIDELYTQPSKTVSNFESNLAFDKNKNLLFLSTSGSLYSLNLINQKTINWIQNFKSENEIIFNGNPIILSNDNIIVSTNNNISLINQNGMRLWNLIISSNVPPKISGDTIFLIDKNNYLIFIDTKTGQIIFSKNIHLILHEDYKKNFQKKIKKINHMFLIKNKLLLVSDNSYFIELNIKNSVNVSSIKKNSFRIASDIIFIENEMILVSKTNRVYKIN